MKYNLLIYRKEKNIGNEIQTTGLSRLIQPSRGIWYDDIKNNEDEVLICNGWFQSPYQKIDIKTKAIFAGIHISDFYGYDNSLILEWMKENNKIVGARDPGTATYLNSVGIKAEFIGCSSLLFDRYDGPRKGIIYLYDNLVHSFSFEEFNLIQRWEYAKQLLEKYKIAELVYTTRLHIALPCLAFGTPVYVIPGEDKRRFSILDYLGIEYNKPFRADISKLVDIYKSFIESQLGQKLVLNNSIMPEIRD